MLPREKRLITGREYARVYQKGKRISVEEFNLIYFPNKLAISRLGVVVGKKFSNRAVKRNRAKRIYREAVQEIYDNISSGYDIVVFVKKVDLKKEKTEDAKGKLQDIFKDTGIMK